MKPHIKIEDILNTWVRRWASYKGCKGYPSLQSFAKESPRVLSRYSINELSDATYLSIDKAVEILRIEDLEAYQILMAIYLQGQGEKAIREAMEIARSTYFNKLNKAKAFMEGAVFGSGLVKVRF